MTWSQLLADSAWLIPFASGGLAGAIVTAYVNAARQKTELAFKLIEQYFVRQPQIAEALGILQNPVNLQTVASYNKVISVGDWYETLGLLCRRRIVNHKLLGKAGILKQMGRFLDECRKANTNGDLSDALKAWTELDAATE